MTESKKKPAMISMFSEKESVRLFPETELKAGNNNSVMVNANTKAIKLMKTDSPRNWRTREPFSAPSTLRIPTSALRLDERAVERFMKLIQAISKVNKAMDASIYK